MHRQRLAPSDTISTLIANAFAKVWLEVPFWDTFDAAGASQKNLSGNPTMHVTHKMICWLFFSFGIVLFWNSGAATHKPSRSVVTWTLHVVGVCEYVMFTLVHAKSCTTKVNKLSDWNTKTLNALRLAANVQKRLSVFKLEQEGEEHHCF